MIGKTISHYKILSELGRGGMGVVYKAEDTRLKRFVALKFLSSQAVGSGKDKIRFIHEAQAEAALDHPNICTVYEIDEVDGQTFISMALCEGMSLEEKVQSGPFNLVEALEIAIQVAQGLDAAHQKGIIHRDIKSSNIMVTTEGRAKITDFGVARLPGGTKITKEGMITGTVSYMSPEQAKGEDIDGRSDIFSLGVVMFEMLTGQLPFRGDHEAAILYGIMMKNPEPLTEFRSDAPDELQKMLDKVLHKSVGSRYQTASELGADLERIIRRINPAWSGIPVAGAPSKPARSPLLKRFSVPFTVLILAVLFLLVFINWPELQHRLGLSRIPTEKHLAVLPFNIIGDDPANQAFCDGLVETLTSMLTQMEQFQGSLWVVPASEVRELEIKSVVEAHQVFNVNLVVTGSIQNIGNKFRLTMNLVDTETLRQLDSAIIEDLAMNISTLQDQTVIEIAHILNVELHPDTRSMLAMASTDVTGAYELYLQGRGYLQRYENIESVNNAVSAFKQAIELDSLYVLAYAGLGEAYWRKYEHAKNPELVRMAQSYCNRAIQMNDKLEAVHITLAVIHRGTGRYEDAIKELEKALQIDPASFEATLELAMNYRELGELDEAEETYKKAIDMKPSYWSGYNKLGVFYWRSGRLDDAEKMFRKVTELTPDNIRAYNNLIGIYYYLGKVDLAKEMCDKSISIKPNPVAYSNLGTIYIYEGQYTDAIPILEEAINLGVNDFETWANLADSYRYTPEYSKKAPETYQRAIELVKEQLVINPNDSYLRSSLARYYAKLEDHQKALTEISSARIQSPNDVVVLYNCILVYELASQRENAIQALQEALEYGITIEELRNDPELVEFRKDPRYQELITK